MKLFSAALALAFLLAGCGHSGMVYLNGTSVQAGYNPETNQLGIGYLDGETLLVGSRENTMVEVELEGGNGVDGTAATLNTRKIKKIRYTTGIQVNGYLVELAGTNPELAAAVLEMMREQPANTRCFAVENGALKEIPPETADSAVLSRR